MKHDCVARASEAIRRVLGVELHTRQLEASTAMCDGWSVQMLTGEGKTFAAVAPALFYAQRGQGVHVVTANPYLAARDAEWSGAALRWLGLTVGVTLPGMTRDELRRAYACDVTFGADREFGFDYLRDNLWRPGDPPVQRERVVAIVDEADAVLLDQARTPLVLSGPAPADIDSITRADTVARDLEMGRDIVIADAERHCELTDVGIARCESLLGIANLYGDSDIDWAHRITMALRARFMLQRDLDHVVVDGVVRVVDELTGRTAEGRAWADGLQQAVEAKEGAAISPERRPVARVTVGSYFRAYEVLVGMSGTLEGAEDELANAYGLRVRAIPSHRPVARIDHGDASFGTADARDAAVADDVMARHQRGQPVLVGTRSIAQSQFFSAALAARGVEHRVLTARNDADEAVIVADAGRAGAVTVATQMAGRGVDIAIDVAAKRAGGLMVWGLEHHPSQRLDMQLRGRSGRQGDPGESRFAVCPDDELADVGQARAAQLDAELRMSVRLYDNALDVAQTHLHRWRQAAATADIEALLHDTIASEAAALAAVPRTRRAAMLADTAGVQPAKRRRDIQDHLRERFESRADELGRAFLPTARAVLSHLLIVMWADQLDVLESRKAFARIPLGLQGDVRRWQMDADRSYREFVRTVEHEWLAQLATIRPGLVPRDEPLPPAPAVVLAPIDVGEPPPEWKGFSFNRWVRNHFGNMLNWEPPIVLTLEAIGDESSGGIRLHVDLDNPTLSVFEVR